MLGPFLLALMTGAATAQDLAGAERLFLDTCARCHGARGDAPTGGGIAGLDRAHVARAVRGAGQMPPIALTEAEIDAIAAWLRVLGTPP